LFKITRKIEKMSSLPFPPNCAIYEEKIEKEELGGKRFL